MNQIIGNRIETHQAACSPMIKAATHIFDAGTFRETGYGSTTHGAAGFKRLSGAQESEIGAYNLEERLATLCDKLRARY